MADSTPPGAVAPSMATLFYAHDHAGHRGQPHVRGGRQTKEEPSDNHIQLYDIAYFNPQQSTPTTRAKANEGNEAQQPSPESNRSRSRGSTQPSRSPSATTAAPKPLTFKEFVSPAAARKSKHERHSRQEWDSRKDDIHKLYIEEGRPLRDVMKIMETRGFKATTKMYKLRLAEWEFNKNNRERDIAAMLQVQGERSAAGKTTTFRRHGKPIQIEAYLRRKGIDTCNLPTVMLEDQRQLPTYIRQLTPPPSVSATGRARLQELLLQSFRDLAWKRHAAMGPGGSWIVEKSRYVGTPTMVALRDMYDADCLFAQGLPKLGGAVCERSFRSLHHLVLDPTLDGFCHLVTNLQRMHSPGIGKETWKYLSGYARAIQATGPIKPLLEHIEKLFDADQTGLEERQEFLTDCIDHILMSDENEIGFPASTITQLYPFLFQIPVFDGAANPQYQRLQRRCDINRLAQLRSVQRELSATPELQSDSPIKAEEAAFTTTMIKRLQAEEEAFFESLQLLMIGDQSDWRSPQVADLCTSILARASDPQFEGGYYAYNAYKGLAAANKALWDQEKVQDRIVEVLSPQDFGATLSPVSPVSASGPTSLASSPYPQQSPHQTKTKLDVAISFLEQAIGIIRHWTESEALLLEDLGKLEVWSREAGDIARVAHAHNMRDECVSNLLESTLSLSLHS
ncbi:hypothetical protein Micbo1qcDRAFT_51504 [Microdochium bolleyi]|uniref:Clr5 domain-containing protein n=1 Tax=Microdochium bolleyi TaxID=196109 RepID=A0A136J6W0_9PEZI|nr:hypothetical protein Micbo1qcDRAFT_51504 [Microdochium bolleyi]